MPKPHKPQPPDALQLVLAALNSAPDWRLVGLPVYEAWFKGPLQAALAALNEEPSA